MTHSTIGFLIIAAALYSCAAGATTVDDLSSIPAPSATGVINAARLTPYENAFVVTQTIATGESSVPGIWTDELRHRVINGKDSFVRTQAIGYFDGRSLVSVNVFDPTTFSPISDFQRNPDGSTERWVIDGTKVVGHLSPAAGAPEVVRSFDAPAAAYDLNCCMRSLLPAALSLRLGATITLPALTMDQDDPASVTYHVVAREKVHAGCKGMVEAWVVETAAPAGGTIKFWIADAAPFLVRMTLTGLPQNVTSKGLHYDQSFDMIN